MKNLIILKDIEIDGKTINAGSAMENVDNAIAALLVMKGMAKEVPVKHQVIGATLASKPAETPAK